MRNNIAAAAYRFAFETFKLQLFYLNVMTQHWQDAHLHWKPEDHGGVREFWLPADSVWKPDIVLQEE